MMPCWPSVFMTRLASQPMMPPMINQMMRFIACLLMEFGARMGLACLDPAHDGGGRLQSSPAHVMTAFASPSTRSAMPTRREGGTRRGILCT
jgi:hypothetical protein